MDKHNLNEWLALTANFAVVVGILFLVVEIRQNNALLESEARYHLLTNQVDAFTEAYTNDLVLSGWLKVESGQDVTPEERFALIRYNRSMLRKWEWEYQQYQNGLIDLGDLPVTAFVDVFPTQPLMAETWQSYRQRQSEEFRVFMEENVVGK